jgi:hypothetical protein
MEIFKLYAKMALSHNLYANFKIYSTNLSGVQFCLQIVYLTVYAP